MLSIISRTQTNSLPLTAAYGEIHFELVGFLCQCAALAFEASRLVMIQILLHGMKMDPLVSLHYYAPVCAVINACIIPFTDGLEPLWNLHRVGILVLFTNAGIAFALNVRLFVLLTSSTPKEKNKANSNCAKNRWQPYS